MQKGPRRWIMVFVLTVSFSLFLGQPVVQGLDLKPDAVAVWNFDEGSGATLKDSSGNGNNGTIVGATWVKGNYDSALRFDGPGYYIRVPDAEAFRLQPPYTLGVWFQTTSSENNGVFLISRGSTYSYGLYLYGDSLALSHYVRGTPNKIYAIGTEGRNIPDGTWHHLVGTCEKGKMKLFFDGKLKSETELPEDLVVEHVVTPGPGGDVFLGCWWGAGNLRGLMGKAYILKRALSEQEVKAIYDEERKRFTSDIEVKKAARAPFIDGKLDDACWQNQTPLDNFTLNDYESTPAKKQTKAYICYDDKNIYIGARCEEPDMAGISEGKTERDDKYLWTNDCVEIFLLPQAGRYYQFLLNAANTLLDIRCDYKIGEDGYVIGGFGEFKLDYSWNCKGFNSTVYKGEDYWSIEMSIPFSGIGGLPKPGDNWHLNIAREEKQLNELSTFSPLFGMFHQPEAFSRLSFKEGKAVLARAPKEFTAVDVTPGVKESSPFPTGKEAVVVVFVNNYLERGYPTTLPKEGEIRDAIDVFASLGEYEPATFSVRAVNKSIKGTRVRIVDDLKSEDGAIISKGNVDIRVVESFKRWVTTRKYLRVERYLEKKEMVDITRDTTQRFWLTVHVPEDARGGIYRSKVLIEAGGTTLKSLNLSVEVLPFKLMPAEGMAYFMYFPEWGLPKDLRGSQAYLKKCFEDMREHGMTTATLYLLPYGTVDGKYQFTFDAVGRDGQFAFAPTMDTLRDVKLLGSGIPAIWLGADLVTPPDDWKKVLDEGKKKNWPELVLYLQDEPGEETRNEKVRLIMEKMKKFKEQYPEYSKVKTTTAMGLDGIKAVGEFYNIWICDAGSVSEELSREAKEKGKELWTYDCALAHVDAEMSRYYFGLWCWKSGVKGAANWAYSSTQDPNSDWDYIAKHKENIGLDYSYVFPSSDGPVPSIGWEATREGIDDYRYLVTLTKLIEKARKEGRGDLTGRGERLLQEMRDKVHIENYLKACLVGNASQFSRGGLYDRPSPETDILKEDYNKFRYQLGQEILKLINAER